MVHLNVERVRKAKGVTKTHLARKLNLTLQGYSHVESGNVRLDVERLKTIAEVLGVSPEIFFDDELTETVITELSNTRASRKRPQHTA